jgi:ATP-dependent DNA ligase
MARRDAADVRLLTRSGHDWTGRFALIAQAASALRVTSCLIDGEAMACDDDGLPVFERLRQRRHDRHVFLYAFDLIELNGNDLRRGPLQVRKTTLASVLGARNDGADRQEPGARTTMAPGFASSVPREHVASQPNAQSILVNGRGHTDGPHISRLNTNH